MVKPSKVPDAWEDDWESQADQLDQVGQEEEASSSTDQAAATTRAERLAKHAEAQRKLWEAAEKPPEELLFVAASNNVPLATGFKPQMKVLSRKPAPKTIARKDPITGLERLTIQDDDDDDADAKKNQPTPEEIRMRQQRELEEKQRRYEEARAKIFGGSSKPSSGPSSGHSTPGNVTPPLASDGRQQGQRGRGRGRGGGYRNDNRQDQHHHRPETPNRRQQSASQGVTRELYDPNYATKPGFNQKRGGDGSGSPRPTPSSTPREEDQIIRSPRGPDGSGRGGFDFARRGGAKED